jgi:GT2 family glycosyltransferase
MDIVAHVLSWNGEKYLPDLFASLDAQTKQGLIVRVVDNGSTDASVRYLQEHYSHSLVARNVKNLGFTGGHNQLFKFTFEKWGGEHLKDKAIVLINQDMILDPRMIEEMENVLLADETVAAVQPKIYRLFAPTNEEEGVGLPVKSDVLDTTGLELTRSWRLEDRGAGALDAGQYDAQTDIFGATGTIVMYRASALMEVLVDAEVFDNDYFAYKEDCDLAIRLRRAGFVSRFAPLAKAWHYRGVYGAQHRSLWQRLTDRRGRRPFLAAVSTRNQLLMLVKNLTCGEALQSAPRLLIEEGGRLLYAMIFEGETRKMMLRSPHLFFRALKKRKEVFAKSKVSSAVLRGYMK